MGAQFALDSLHGDPARGYAQSQVDALKIAVGGVALFALLGLLCVTRRLPANPLRAAPIEA
jgi:hypothetical protein